MSTVLKQMREKVLRELEHIPKTSASQGELRAVYWTKRMHSLGKKAKSNQTASEVLQESIKSLEKDYADFKFDYDKEFFV